MLIPMLLYLCLLFMFTLVLFFIMEISSSESLISALSKPPWSLSLIDVSERFRYSNYFDFLFLDGDFLDFLLLELPLYLKGDFYLFFELDNALSVIFWSFAT